eukprot:scaffold16034_cov70-Attheya_sp.AAC.1
MSHTTSVALKHYDDDNAYRRAVPANIATNVVTAESVAEIMQNYTSTPAFKNVRCFDKDTKVLTEPLPSVEVFVRQHAYSPKEFCCWGVGCDEKFTQEGDHRAHMRHNCDVVSAQQCPKCGVIRKKTLKQ